jgi:pimeloyl-ACP methyl ester carboxylesterase
MTYNPPWTIHEYSIPAFHPRTTRRSVRNHQTSKLNLHIKEYRIVPVADSSSRNAVTIIFAHGAGSVKEEYEPFFSDLLQNTHCPRIQSIWAADIVGHGQSYLLNEAELGDELDWFAGARDIVQLVNHFRDSMSPPLVGIGQSWGAFHILSIAAWHPRLFQAIIPIEAVVEIGTLHNSKMGSDFSRFPGITVGYTAVRGRDRWPNADAARRYFLASTYYSTFDERVFEKVLQYELRPTPNGDGDELMLTTPKIQGAIVYMRPDPPLRGLAPAEDYNTRPTKSLMAGGFYRAEPFKLKELMPGIHCKTLYLWSRDDSFISDEDYGNRLVSVTGTGLGGGGGKATGQVTEEFVDRGGHALPFQNPKGTALHVAKYLAGIDKWWREEEAKQATEPVAEPGRVPGEWIERINKL